MSAQDKLAAQTYISSPQLFRTTFNVRGYTLPPIQPMRSKNPVQVPIPTLELNRKVQQDRFTPTVKPIRRKRK